MHELYSAITVRDNKIQHLNSEMDVVRENRDQMQTTYVAESEDLKTQVQVLQTQLNQVCQLNHMCVSLTIYSVHACISIVPIHNRKHNSNNVIHVTAYEKLVNGTRSLNRYVDL